MFAADAEYANALLFEVRTAAHVSWLPFTTFLYANKISLIM